LLIFDGDCRLRKDTCMGIFKDFTKVMSWGLVLLCPLLIQCTHEDDPQNTCDESIQPQIEPMFRIYLQANHQNGDPYTGFAKFTIEKHYCNGNINGVFKDSTNNVINGFWKPITTQYIMANDSDYVAARFQIEGFPDLGYYYFYFEVADRLVIDEFGQRIFEDTIKCTF
jgi:hypothetical protein